MSHRALEAAKILHDAKTQIVVRAFINNLDCDCFGTGQKVDLA